MASSRLMDSEKVKCLRFVEDGQVKSVALSNVKELAVERLIKWSRDSQGERPPDERGDWKLTSFGRDELVRLEKEFGPQK